MVKALIYYGVLSWANHCVARTHVPVVMLTIRVYILYAMLATTVATLPRQKINTI